MMKNNAYGLQGIYSWWSNLGIFCGIEDYWCNIIQLKLESNCLRLSFMPKVNFI